ncbi:PREDICTED: uncharacterized protein LOC105566042 [Vollenhovia emeryi]|uniref:uncharacterized protein LOC105566042 n=1 Tax=Vollenhovia emeryi TaxID=411798 RepID=UPI0005F4271E|nr:PREDICTED: uncharacterized protein LOC105566042 [Vollenhovia emeryi]
MARNNVADRSKFCKACCKPRRHICPRALARSQSRTLQRHARNDNFVLISARYITEFYRWTNEYLFTDDFLRSIVASAILFAIGLKLTGELNAWSLSRIVVR